MKLSSLSLLALACLVESAPAQEAPRAQAIYLQTCAACHAQGAANAPKFGDKATWKKLGNEGFVHVAAHGWLGTGGMPPRGGRTDITLEDFSSVVAYMGRSGGVDWKEPDPKTLKAIEREVAKELAKRRKQ